LIYGQRLDLVLSRSLTSMTRTEDGKLGNHCSKNTRLPNALLLLDFSENKQHCKIMVSHLAVLNRRYQWLSGLRGGLAVVRLLRLWVRVQPAAWMSVVCVVR
jgi:hypothetical protein